MACHRDGYAAVSQQEDGAADVIVEPVVELSDTHEAYPYGIEVVSTAHAKYDLLLNRPESLPIEAKNLLQHIEAKLWSCAMPQFYLQIDVYKDHQPSADKEPVTSVTVALPQMSNEARTIYCRADDSPCLRGGYPPNSMANEPRSMRDRVHRKEFDVNDRSTSKLTQSWSLVASGKPLGIVSSAGNVVLADQGIVDRWNTRQQRTLCPPWRSMAVPATESEHALDANDVLSPDTAPWLSRSNRVLARNALQAFLDDKAATSKYLVCPQSCYGWDLQLLENIITSDLQRSQREFSSTGILYIFAPQHGSVKLSIQSKAPAATMRSFNHAQLERAFIHHPWMAQQYCAMALIICLPASILIMAILPSFGTLLLLATLTAVFALAVVGFLLFDGTGTVHEPIGVACALKRWIAVPSAKAREDVFTSFPRAIDAENVQGVWYALIGAREQDWWAHSRSAILTAVRQNQRGPIFVDEMYAAPSASSVEHLPDHPSAVNGGDASSSLHVLPPNYTEQETGMTSASIGRDHAEQQIPSTLRKH